MLLGQDNSYKSSASFPTLPSHPVKKHTSRNVIIVRVTVCEQLDKSVSNLLGGLNR